MGGSSVQGMGRLAQSARSTQLKSARGIMLGIGILTVLANGALFALAASQVQEAIDAEIAKLPPGRVADPVKVQEVKERAIKEAHLVAGGAMMVGLIFVGCGLLVDKQPVVSTATALGLYIASTAVFAAINPGSITAGIYIKIFVIIGLVKAVQAAIAYQKEQTAAAEA
jgi:hypothetical protein